MCTFVTQTLTLQDVSSEKSANYGVYLKPTPEKEYYRFRLLWFTDKTDRSSPFVTRFVHESWENKPDGININHSIVCPTTPFVRPHWDGDPYTDCPICRFMNNNFIAWKESNYKDKQASKNYRTFKKKFQAIIPVYVISDPCYDPNNGKLKVLVLDDSEIYDKFKKLVIERNQTTTVFNGENAIDFLVRADNVQHVLNEGTENEYKYTKREIVQMGFSKTPYTISAINKEAVDAFPFSDVYYTAPTPAGLRNYYKTHCLQTITDDDADMADMADMADAAPAVDRADTVETSLDVKPDKTVKTDKSLGVLNEVSEATLTELANELETIETDNISNKILDEVADLDLDTVIDETDDVPVESDDKIDVDALLEDIGI